MYDKNKKYRPNVAAIVLSSSYPLKCEVFLGERSDIVGAWQFPQGGVDRGETFQDALFRELKEEIGTDKIEIIAEHPELFYYDFPENVAEKMYPFDGQKQKYFLVRLKDNRTVNIETEHPEFTNYKFKDISTVLEDVTFFKKAIYIKVFKYFKQNGYL
jgi:putative (di)nucleoside polyphosphate hydrolase